MRVYKSADDDLLRVHVHGPELTQVSSDGPAQGRCAVVWRGAQQLRVLLQNGLPHQPGPYGEGEIRPVQRPGGQVQKHRLRRALRHQGRRSRRGQGTLQRAYIIALFLHGVNIPLCRQLLIGVLHGDDADLQVLGQRPLGGQLLPGRQGAGQNIPANTGVQLGVQTLASVLFQGIGQHGNLRSGIIK